MFFYANKSHILNQIEDFFIQHVPWILGGVTGNFVAFIQNHNQQLFETTIKTELMQSVASIITAIIITALTFFLNRYLARKFKK